MGRANNTISRNFFYARWWWFGEFLLLHSENGLKKTAWGDWGWGPGWGGMRPLGEDIDRSEPSEEWDLSSSSSGDISRSGEWWGPRPFEYSDNWEVDLILCGDLDRGEVGQLSLGGSRGYSFVSPKTNE